MLFETAAAKAAATAASAVLVGGAAVGVSTAAGSCPDGQERTLFGCAKVVEYEGEEVRRGTGTTSGPTVSVAFRDEHGNRTGSGMSASDQFEWLGGKKMGKDGDGMLIEVRQLTKGRGGWGDRYTGWIPVKYTQIPAMFE
jgi:hypothetical protein